MHKNIICSALLLGALALPGFAGSFSDDFSSAPADSVLGSPWQLSVADNGTTLTYRIQNDTLNYFGKGSSNKYLALNDSVSGNPNIQFYYASNNIASQTGQVSFGFYDPGTSGTTTNASGMQIRLGTSTSAAAGNTTSPFGVYLFNGGIYTNQAGSSAINKDNLLGSYDLQKAYQLSIVFNNSATEITYGDAYTLAGGTMDIWLGDVLIASALGKFNNNTSTADIGNVTINGSSSGEFHFYIDNFSVSDSIAIPEPATSALLGMLAVFGYMLIKRRRRA